MRPKSLILLVLALGCGLVAAVGINQILATPSNDVQTIGIVVAKAEIKKGDLIKPDDIRLQEWHVDALPEGAITKIDDLAERRVKTLIVPGEALLESKLVPKGVGNGGDLPAGMKGVAVQVDSVSGGAGLVLPGDNVDVLVHVVANAGNGIPMTQTKVLLKNVKVHAVDSALDRPDPGETSMSAKTVTLTVTPRQAGLVTHASQIGKIQLVLRSQKESDDQEELDQTVTNADVLGTTSGDALANAAPLPTLTPQPQPAGSDAGGKGILDILKEMRDLGPPESAEKPWKMVLIEGIDSKEMEFTSESPLARVTKSESEPKQNSPILRLPPVEEEETSDSP